MKHEKGNVVFLVFATNTAYVQVVAAKPTDITVDFEKGTWSTTSVQTSAKKPFKIGEYRDYFENGRHGAIGVFDRTKIDHLNSLAHAATEAIRDRGSVLDD